MRSALLGSARTADAGSRSFATAQTFRTAPTHLNAVLASREHREFPLMLTDIPR